MSTGFDLQRWNELEAQKKKLELEAVRLYRPSPLQLPFHREKVPEAVVRGGKRSGKSVSVAHEFASRILGIPLKDPDGNEIPLAHPVSTIEAPLQYWIIGWDTSHAATIHRLLFQRGMGGTFKAIKDEATGEWRIWNRANPRDAARASEAVLTEPLIPPRYWHEGNEDAAFAWEEKKAYKWQSCRLANGAMLYYWPSSAKSPKQGEAVSGIWIDEDIQFPGHLKEWQDRLTDMRGWFLWSVWPHTKNNALIELLDRAEQQEFEEKPRIKSFQLIMTQNPFLTDEGKSQAIDRMGSEEEISRRDRGELLMHELEMYSFDAMRHLVKPIEEGETVDAKTPMGRLRSIYAASGRLPHNWTRYLAIDPSHTRTACLSFAVPPPGMEEGVALGDLAVVEWEVVVVNASAEQLAQEHLKGLMSGVFYEAFIMDRQIGRQTNTGRDDTVFDKYAEAFRKAGLISRQTHHHFIEGCNVPSTRYRAVRDMLVTSDSGIPMLVFIERQTWQTQREFHRYRKKSEDKDGYRHIYDQPANPRVYDCMAALEYGATFLLEQFKLGTAWQNPSVYGGRVSPALRRAREILKKQQEDDPEYVHLGPGDAA